MLLMAKIKMMGWSDMNDNKRYVAEKS